MSLTTETRWHSGTKEFESRAVYLDGTAVATMYRHFPCSKYKNGHYTVTMPGSPREDKHSPRMNTVTACMKWVEAELQEVA